MNIRSPRLATGGFSLIELVVVLVVAGLIVAIAGPSMAGYIGRNQTRRALDQLSSDLAYARILAIRGGERTSLVFGATQYSIRVDRDPVEVVKTVNLAADFPGVGLAAPTADGVLTFNARGLLASAGSGSIVASLGGVIADSLYITVVGRVYRDY